MISDKRDDGGDNARRFECFSCPNGCICLRWCRTLLLHFGQEDLPRILECLEDILKQPSASFCLGAGCYCACRTADGFCYLVCHDRVVLRLSEEDAHSLHATLASFGTRSKPHMEV